MRVFEIVAFGHVAGISLNYEENTCGQQPNNSEALYLTKKGELNFSWLNRKSG